MPYTVRMYSDIEKKLALSREFDGILGSAAPASEVFGFLDSAGGLGSVFDESLLVRRMFESDFFFRCKDGELGRFMELVSDPASPKPYIAFLAWQLLSSRSSRTQALRYECRKRLADVQKEAPIRHPYRYRPAFGDLRRFDEHAAELCAEDRFLEIVGDKDIVLAVSNVGYSLYQGRMMQPDFLSALPENLRPLLLDGVNLTIGQTFAVKFAKAVISGCFPLDLKLRVVRMFGGAFFGASRFSDIIGRYSSFQEFALDMTVSGKCFETSTFALYLLAERPQWLVEWIDADADGAPRWLGGADLKALARMGVENGA